MLLARRFFLFAAPSIVAVSSLMPLSVRVLAELAEPSFDEQVRRVLALLAKNDSENAPAPFLFKLGTRPEVGCSWCPPERVRFERWT